MELASTPETAPPQLALVNMHCIKPTPGGDDSLFAGITHFSKSHDVWWCYRTISDDLASYAHTGKSEHWRFPRFQPVPSQGVDTQLLHQEKGRGMGSDVSLFLLGNLEEA